ncbi:alpha/beta hydrolase [bacterium]|nr:alpha/beta hydrolase [bacterium]
MAEKILNVLLLRGLVREQRHWGRFPEVLREVVPNFKLHFLDLPGVGTEFRRSSPRSISEITDDLRDRWLSLRDSNTGGWGLFSISLGSMVALDWGDRYPDDFSWLSLMNTSAANMSPVIGRLRFLAIPKLLQIASTKDSKLKELRILKLTTSMLVDVNDLAEEWSRYVMSPVRARSLALSQLAAALRFKAPSSLAVPACMFVGMEDKLVDPNCSLSISKNLSLDALIHNQGGHDVCLDDPRWVADQLREWVSRAT